MVDLDVKKDIAYITINRPDGLMGFPETGIGIYPGLGGMLRTARHAPKKGWQNWKLRIYCHDP